jgi:hypothetical protein
LFYTSSRDGKNPAIKLKGSFFMKRFALGILLLLSAVTGLAAQADLQVLAVVKLNRNEAITLKLLRTRVETYEKQAKTTFTPTQRSQILDALIDEKLVVQAADKAGVTVTDSQVDQYFLQNMSQQIGKKVTEKELSDIIQQQTNMSLDDFMMQQVGMHTDEYKAYLKNQLISQQYILSQKHDEIQKIAPTDDEIRAFYEMNKASFVWNDMLKMFLLVVPKESDPDAAKAKATKFLNDYTDKKITLDKLRIGAREQNAGYQAGDLLISKTQQHAQQLGISYKDLLTLFGKEKGFISGLTETDKDFQFYQILEKYDAKMLQLSDVVQPDTTITVYDYIRQNLTQQKQSQYMMNAIKEITKTLNTPENVERKKTGDALLKLLAWEGNK